MKYQDCAEALQADDCATGWTSGAAGRANVNINPATGLIIDYLNHFSDPVPPQAVVDGLMKS